MSKHYSKSTFLSLVVLNFIVGFGWIAYHNYQPKVLEAFNLQNVGGTLFYAQWIILFAVPGLAGKLSDNMLRNKNKYLIVYITGITVAAMTFMALALGVGIENILNLRPLVPFLVVIWLISMNMFVAPANALLKNIAEQDKLPRLMAILIIGIEGVYALEPVIIPLIDAMGAALTFIGGGVLVTIAGVWFQSKLKQNPEIMIIKNEGHESHSTVQFIIAAIAFGSIFGFILIVFPELVSEKLQIEGNISASLLLAFSTLIAYPVSRLAGHYSIRSLTLSGWSIALLAILIMYLLNGLAIMYVATIIMGFAFSLLSVTAFPLALKNIPGRNLALGTGIFLGIAEGFEGLFQWLMI